MSSRELRATLEPFEATASGLRAYWESHDKSVQLGALQAMLDMGGELVEELAHPEYDHVRAVRLSRLMFDAGLALLDVIDEELAMKTDVDAGLRETRGAALTFLCCFHGNGRALHEPALGITRGMTTSPGYSRVVLPIALIEQRRRLGLDRRDEVWDGELHMVPQPTLTHQSLEKKLLKALDEIAARRGLDVLTNVAVRDPDRDWDDYRIPDITVFDPNEASDAAIEGRAEVVVELLSPNDESRNKSGFYAKRGVREVWLVDPKKRTVEVFTIRRDRYEPIEPEGNVLRSPALAIDILFAPLSLRDGQNTYDI